jgi:C4-dicarboxylate transporter DctM subunit
MNPLENAAILAFILFWVFLLIDFPLAVAVGLASMLALVVTKTAPLSILPYSVMGAVDSFPLLATPLFVLVGILMTRSGIAKLLVEVAKAVLGRVPGGLPIATIIVGAMLGSMSGSNIANVAALSFLIGGMFMAGYPKPFAVAVVATACTFGVIIPPSINLIIYGVIADTSISKLFAAGIGPGLLLAFVLCSYIFATSYQKKFAENVASPEHGTALAVAKRAIWGLLAPVIILGGIYGGVFTATESAAVAVVYLALVDAIVYRQIKISDIPEILLELGRTNGVIMLLLATAAMFGWLITTEGIAQDMAKIVVSASGGNKYIVLLMINAFLVVIGAFIEPGAAIYMLIPLLKPTLVQLNIDLIHFGAIMTTNLSMAHLTPPVGLSLFLAAQLGGVPFTTVARTVVPFIVCEMFVVLLVTFIPGISLFFVELLS